MPVHLQAGAGRTRECCTAPTPPEAGAGRPGPHRDSAPRPARDCPLPRAPAGPRDLRRSPWAAGRGWGLGAWGRAPSSPWGGPAGAQGPAPHPPAQAAPGSGRLPPEDPRLLPHPPMCPRSAQLGCFCAEDGAASVSTAGTTAWTASWQPRPTASRQPRQGPGADGSASLSGRCVPCCPHHSPSRAPSKGASEP